MRSGDIRKQESSFCFQDCNEIVRGQSSDRLSQSHPRLLHLPLSRFSLHLPDQFHYLCQPRSSHRMSPCFKSARGIDRQPAGDGRSAVKQRFGGLARKKEPGIFAAYQFKRRKRVMYLGNFHVRGRSSRHPVSIFHSNAGSPERSERIPVLKSQVVRSLSYPGYPYLPFLSREHQGAGPVGNGSAVIECERRGYYLALLYGLGGDLFLKMCVRIETGVE